MKKFTLLLLAVVVAVALPFLLTHFANTTLVKNIDNETTKTDPDYQEPTLADKVGQLFIIGHWSETLTNETTKLIEKHMLGGVIVMDAGGDGGKIRNWAEVWQSASSPTPLFIGIDQEGGVVSRLKDATYTQTAQPDILTTENAYSIANRRASELRELNINVNFAPVLDVSTNDESFMYERVFREPNMIASLSDAMIRGYQNGGVLAAPKHFPGHPDTADDSHLTLPVLELTEAEYQQHTSAFEAVLKAGNVELLMTAHVGVPALDSEFPTTVSPAVIEDLRTRIGYDGVIITDDLAMQAISDRWSYDESAVMALEAGVDMVMLAAEPEVVSQTIEAVLKAVETGGLSEARIDEAYDRVVRAKQSLR